MDERWEREVNGTAPSFQEFLAAEHVARERFLKNYMASRGIVPTERARRLLEDFLDDGAGALASDPAQVERLLDALVRIRPECITRKRAQRRREHAL